MFFAGLVFLMLLFMFFIMAMLAWGARSMDDDNNDESNK